MRQSLPPSRPDPLPKSALSERQQPSQQQRRLLLLLLMATTQKKQKRLRRLRPALPPSHQLEVRSSTRRRRHRRRAITDCGAQVGGPDLGQPVRKLSSKCGGCLVVRYCSVAYSREAWPSHKAACKKKQTEVAAAKAASAAANARDAR